MRRRLINRAVCAFALLAVAGAPAALGATPQRIYRDYANNGRLDAKYSRADLQRAQRDAAAQGYPKVGVQGAIAQALGTQPVTATKATLPFTGLDLALAAVGGTLLLIAGVGFRRLGKSRQ
jgi:hypothetical protein